MQATGYILLWLVLCKKCVYNLWFKNSFLQCRR